MHERARKQKMQTNHRCPEENMKRNKSSDEATYPVIQTIKIAKQTRDRQYQSLDRVGYADMKTTKE